MEALIQRLSSPAIIFPILLFISHLIYKRLTALSTMPADLPCISKDPSKVSPDVGANLASISSVKDWLELDITRQPDCPTLHLLFKLTMPHSMARRT